MSNAHRAKTSDIRTPIPELYRRRNQIRSFTVKGMTKLSVKGLFYVIEKDA